MLILLPSIIFLLNLIKETAQKFRMKECTCDIPMVPSFAEPEGLYDDERGVIFRPPVYLQRLNVVNDILCDERWSGSIGKIADLGCSSCPVLMYLKDLAGLQTILSVDLDTEALSNIKMREPLKRDYLYRRRHPLKLLLINGNASSPDYRLLGCDAIISIEMIEHMDPPDLERLPHTIFGYIKPHLAVFTTPNADFNVLFNSFKANNFRHDDHRFEWSREQFEDWANNIILRYPDYSVTFSGVGPGPVGTSEVGCCSQLALFVHGNYEPQEPKAEPEIHNLYKVYDENIASKALMEDIADLKKSQLQNHKDVKSHNLEELKANNLKHVDSDQYTWFGFNWGEDAPPANQYYRVYEEIDYPHDKDTRTLEQRIADEASYHIHRLVHAVSLEWEHSRETTEDWRIRIPLDSITSALNQLTEDTELIREILISRGYEMEKDFIIHGQEESEFSFLHDSQSDSGSISSEEICNIPVQGISEMWDVEENWDGD